MSEIYGQEVGVETRRFANKWQATVDKILERAKLLKQDEELKWKFPDPETAAKVKHNLRPRKHGLGVAVADNVLSVWKVKTKAVE